ncbi:MAG: hypothetical protein ACLVBP_15520 [Ruminococcus sp.]
MNNNFEINDWVKITMKNKSVICGQIAAFGKKLVEGVVIRFLPGTCIG